MPKVGDPNLVLERVILGARTCEMARLPHTLPVLFTGHACRHEIGEAPRCETCSALALESLQGLVTVQNLGAAP